MKGYMYGGERRGIDCVVYANKLNTQPIIPNMY